MTQIITDDMIATAIESQLAMWPLAKANYDALARCRRKRFDLGGLHGAVQWNPARIRSTGADISADAIKDRGCFLCRDARPKEQIVSTVMEGWEMLINPYPIFPVHFTVVSEEHQPQGEIPFDMISFAEMAPSLCAFFNGAKAGASAPDHLHFQAVLKSELPLLRVAEKYHTPRGCGLADSADFGIPLPFRFFSAVITPDEEGMRITMRLRSLCGADTEGNRDPGLQNTFFWTDPQGRMRAIVVPRAAHRPDCYGTGPGQLLVSPGAIDMAGIIITPIEEDFERIDTEKIREIYSEVAYVNQPC